MTYLYEDELRTKAQGFIEALTQAGVSVAPEPAMFRDYMVKIAAGSEGFIRVNYSPKKSSFSLTFSELHDKALAERINAIWDSLIQKGRPSPATTQPSAAIDLEEVEYYLNILTPYRHLSFDFIDLARALQNATGDGTTCEAHRFNFDELERIYHTVRAKQ